MSDLISKQDAIDAVDKCDAIYINNLPVMADKLKIRNALLDLPTCNTTCNNLATDCISRQAAIDAMFEVTKKIPTAYIRAKATLEELPTVQPERRTGKWVNIKGNNRADCNRCGTTGRAWMNFCFGCGADMREEGEKEC